MMQLDAQRLAALLNMPELTVFVYDTLDSTNDECRRKLAAGEGPCLVLAEIQTSGKGRSGKSFYSPEGGLYMSIALPGDSEVVGITCRAAVAAAEAIEAVTGISCGIKWVNDLYLHGKKICGILAERTNDGVILGIGINLRPTAVPEELKHIVGFLDCGDVRELLAAKLTERLLSKGDYMQEYRRRSVVLGKDIFCRVGNRSFTAKATEILDDGSLLVIGPDGRECLQFGEVFLGGDFN